MKAGAMTYVVIGISKYELLTRLQSVKRGEAAEFDARAYDDPSEMPEQHHFEVRVQKLHNDLNIEAVAVDVIDQDDRWFRLVFNDDTKPLIFQILTT